jgi:hypothetical protein
VNRALEMIYANFPNVKKRMEDPSSVVLSNEQELVFYQLALFISEPKKKKKTLLNHTDAYNILDDKQMRLYLDVLDYSFNPSGRLNKKNETFKASDYIKQRTFFNMLVEAVPNTTMDKKAYFWRYVTLGTVVPPPDLVIDGVLFWLKETVEAFLEEEKKSPLRKK